jgi:acetyl esterase
VTVADRGELIARVETEDTLDHQIADLIELVSTSIEVPANPTPQDRRDAAAVVAPLLRGPIESDNFVPINITERAAHSTDGAQIGVRLYTPQQGGIPATVLYIHGGGWVANTVESYDPEIRRLVTKTRMTVASVDYRLSPEHRRPVAIEDCLAAARMLIDSGDAQILAIAGDSAGGNLALECAIALKDDGVDLAALLLLYPVVDPAAQANASYQKNGRDYLLTSADMAHYWQAYLGSQAIDSYVEESPFEGAKLNGLPLTVVVTAGFDPLHDEGRELALDLVSAEVPVVYLPNPSLTHGFQQMVPRIEAATIAVDRAYAEFLEPVTEWIDLADSGAN